jgi:hypothetical protein
VRVTITPHAKIEEASRAAPKHASAVHAPA